MKIKSEEKQQAFPEVERVEIEQLNKEIDGKVFEIQDAVHRLIMVGNDPEIKRSCLKTLELLMGGIHGLNHLQETSNSQGTVTMNRGESSVVLEKISVKAKSKKNVRDGEGQIIEKVTSDMKILESDFKRIKFRDSELGAVIEHAKKKLNDKYGKTRKDIDE